MHSGRCWEGEGVRSVLQWGRGQTSIWNWRFCSVAFSKDLPPAYHKLPWTFRNGRLSMEPTIHLLSKYVLHSCGKATGHQKPTSGTLVLKVCSRPPMRRRCEVGPPLDSSVTSHTPGFPALLVCVAVDSHSPGWLGTLCSQG